METMKAFKRKMLLWASNWSQEEQQPGNEFTPDIVEIAQLLMSTGYRVRFMDRCLPKQMHPVPDVPPGSPACRVVLMCPGSGLRMELDGPTTSCKCPSPDSGLGSSWTVGEARNDRFQSICPPPILPVLSSNSTPGNSGDPITHRIEEVVNSTIPRPAREVSKSVAELIGGLFKVMRLFPDENHNDAKTADALKPLSENLPTNPTSKHQASVDPSPTKTPVTGIAVVTPNAPCVPKLSPGDARTGVPGRYRSLDTLIASGGFPDDLPEPGQLTPKAEEPETEMDVDGDADVTLAAPGSGKKAFISKSSPAVHYTEQFQRSDTFVFGDAEGDDVTNENGKRLLVRRNTYFVSEGVPSTGPGEEPRPGPPPRRISSSLVPAFSQSGVLSKLQDVQQAISEIIFMVAGNERGLANIGEVSKASKAVANATQKITDTVRPIRCLSDFGSVPNLSRAATTVVRSILRPNIRRNATTLAAPATPTTSRRGITDQTKRSSTSSLAATAGASGKNATSPRLGANRSTSSAAIGQKASGSPSSTMSLASNSKLSSSKRYSNVQSSIPKPGAGARK